MSIVLEQLLSLNSQAKWLIASIFLLLSLPVLLPFLFLCSFLGVMLLLPLGCALVGFLSWQRLCQQPAAATACPAPIRDEKQGRLIEWVEKGKDTCPDNIEESNKWGGDKNHPNISNLPNGDGNDANLGKHNGNGATSEGDVFFWYNPLASIFDAEKQAEPEGAEVESESSTSDAESILSDYHEIAEVYQSKDLENLLSKGECPDIDFEVESLNDNAADYDIEAALTSPKLNVQGFDEVEAQPCLSDKPECLFVDNQDYLSDILLTNVDQTALSNEQEEMWFQEMQLELEKYEILHACNATNTSHTDWIDWIDTAASNNERQMHSTSATDASHDAKSSRGKGGKTSSIASLLSTGSGSISMTSTVCSTGSSSSTTWSAWSEESCTNIFDSVNLKKSGYDGLGRKGSTTFNGRTGYNGGLHDRLRVLGDGIADRQEGGCTEQRNKRVGVSAANRKKMVGASDGLLGTQVDGWRGCVKASKELTAGAELNRQGRRYVCRRGMTDSTGRAEEGSGASKARVVGGGGSRVAEEEVKRRRALQDETENNNHYYMKKGSNDSTARRSGRAAWLGGGGAAAMARVQTACPTNSRVSAPRRHVSGGQMRHVNRTRGHVTGSEATSGGGGAATSEVEDVQKRIVHVNSEDKKPSPPYARIHASADDYPQLLEFWRGIERAFLQVTTTTTSSPSHGTSS